MPGTRPTGSALLLSVVVVLAGCGGLVSSPDGSPGTETVARASTPETPPGLYESGDVEPTVLARAHGFALKKTTFTKRREVTDRYPNGTLRQRVVSVYRDGPGARVLATREVAGTRHRSRLNGTSGESTRWSNETVSLVRVRLDDGSVRYQHSEPGGGDPTLRDYLPVMFGSLNETVATGATTQNGTTVYHVLGLGATDADVFVSLPGATVRDLELEAAVRRDGLITHYRLEYVVVQDETTFTRTVEVSFTDLRRTEAPEPDWVETALARTNESDG